MYGLARHGLIPGARSLAEAAYAVLLAAARELHVEEVDFVLEQLNYRFNPDSLLHHLRGYTRNRRDLEFHTDHRKRVWVRSDRDARREYNRLIKVCPSQVRFGTWITDTLARRVECSLTDRTHRLADVAEPVVDLGGDRVEFH